MFLAKIVKRALKPGDMKCSLKWTGEASRFNADPPDVCVLDIMLPNKDGSVLRKK